VFTANTYLRQFRFRFVKLLSGDNLLAKLSMSVTAAAAGPYDYSDVFAVFANLKAIPALAFSPISAIYTDGESGVLSVSLVDALGTGVWPYGDDAQFTLHILPEAGVRDGVAVEPSTLAFSKASLADPLQQFKLVHTNPAVFLKKSFYNLAWSIRFGGQLLGEATPITSVVSQDAKRVILSRYQIIPKFPHVLSYGWQKASFNLSHIPIAHISFTPRMPRGVDAPLLVSEHGSAHPGGRVEFDPSVIVAGPGQQVVEFKVKAQPGVDRDTLYYRVDWQVAGDDNDLVNYVDSLNEGNSGLNVADGTAHVTFATWHIASASVAHVSLVILFVSCLTALFAML
jgi:hypothetical protein